MLERVTAIASDISLSRVASLRSWETEPCEEPTGYAVQQVEPAAMCLSEALGYSQPKSDAAGVFGPRSIRPIEWPQHIGLFRVRDAGAAIRNFDDQFMRRGAQFYACRTAELDCIINEI